MGGDKQLTRNFASPSPFAFLAGSLPPTLILRR
jgi:hypothetical protein